MSQNDETINTVSRAERPSILEDDWPWTGNELPMTDEEEAEIRKVMLLRPINADDDGADIAILTADTKILALKNSPE